MDKMKFSYDYLYDWNSINEKKKEMDKKWLFYFSNFLFKFMLVLLNFSNFYDYILAQKTTKKTKVRYLIEANLPLNIIYH